MEPVFKVYPTFKSTLTDFQAVIAYFFLVGFAGVTYEKQSIYGITFLIIWAIPIIFLIKKRYRILCGDPILEIRADGIWSTYDKRLITWKEIISVETYRDPDIIAINFPFNLKDTTYKITSFLPKSFLLPHQSIYLTKKRVRDPLNEIIEIVSRNVTIKECGAASELTKRAAR